MGWRTSRTKVIGNAMIGYCQTRLLTPPDADELPVGREISFRVPGYPPAKNEALSMLGELHPHAPRVRLLLETAREALQAHAAFIPVMDGPVALNLVLYPDLNSEPWDATNYLGGVADVLEDKSHHGSAVAHLGDLAQIWLYRNDRQIKEIGYREERATSPGYLVTVTALAR